MNDKKKTPFTWIQWVVSGASLLLVLMLLGFLLHEAFTETDLPPVITISQKTILPAGQEYIVEFTVKNSGGRTAQNLEVEGVLMEDGKEIEKSNATVSFVPSDSQRQGGLIFSSDPRRYTLEIQPKGYDRP